MPSQFSPSDFGLPEQVPCPFCRGRNTELQSPFGSQLSVATYWCNSCHTAFEFMKGEVRSAHAAGGRAANPRARNRRTG
jgi:hypothetical protein